jgi:hypothetical protein
MRRATAVDVEEAARSCYCVTVAFEQADRVIASDWTHSARTASVACRDQTRATASVLRYLVMSTI